MPSVLVDAGPLIALVDRSDKHHRRVKGYLKAFTGRLLTTWPVLAEACHFMPEATQIAFLRWAEGGGLGVVELDETALGTLADWKQKYADLPMDLADASLLWAAQRSHTFDILTIDLKDFSVYRLPSGQALTPVL